ncbi:MAG: hypothetical protein IPH84_11975 [Bacteroidales bacterium]|nr:hypothetical protein [Bacteroidales bacterium]
MSINEFGIEKKIRFELRMSINELGIEKKIRFKLRMSINEFGIEKKIRFELRMSINEFGIEKYATSKIVNRLHVRPEDTNGFVISENQPYKSKPRRVRKTPPGFEIGKSYLINTCVHFGQF